MAKPSRELAGKFLVHESEELHSSYSLGVELTSLSLAELVCVEVEVTVLSWPLLNLIHGRSNAIKQNAILRATVIPTLTFYVTKIRWVLYVTYQNRCIAL